MRVYVILSCLCNDDCDANVYAHAIRACARVRIPSLTALPCLKVEKEKKKKTPEYNSIIHHTHTSETKKNIGIL